MQHLLNTALCSKLVPHTSFVQVRCPCSADTFAAVAICELRRFRSAYCPVHFIWTFTFHIMNEQNYILPLHYIRHDSVIPVQPECTS